MIENLSEILTQLFLFLSGGGLASWVTMKYTRKSAQADVLEHVQSIYQKLVNDLKDERDELRKDRDELRQELYTLEKRVDELEKQRKAESSYLCGSALICVHRKKYDPANLKL